MVFAFGLGRDGLINPDVGHFQVISEGKSLPILPCSENGKVSELYKDSDGFESLYCLQDYSEYSIEKSKALSLTFQAC